MKVAKLLVLSLLLLGCGARQVDDDSDAMDGPTGMPDWSPCVSEGEVETCADACAAEGMTCVANGCPAEPDYCSPGDCSLATQALVLDTSVFCTDASVGTFVATTCEEPIHWLFATTLRCCCAQDD
jgi:hypothetical protein